MSGARVRPSVLKVERRGSPSDVPEVVTVPSPSAREAPRPPSVEGGTLFSVRYKSPS